MLKGLLKKGSLLLLLVVLVIAGCSGQGSNGSSANSANNDDGASPVEETLKLRIARQSGPSTALLYVADEKGLFEKHGLDVEIVSFASSRESVEALLSGQLDMTFGSSQVLISNAVTSGNVISLGAVSQSPGDQKVVVIQEALDDPEALRGKSVGVTVGTSSEYVMDLYLDSIGLEKGTDVTYVEVAPPETIALMQRGDIAAFSLWEPNPSNALASMGDRIGIAATGGELGYPQTIYTLVPIDKLEANEEAFRRALLAMHEAADIVKGDLQETARIVGEFTQLPVDEVLPMIESNRFEVFADELAMQEVISMGTWLAEQGIIPEAPRDVAEYIDTSLLDALE